jgi:Fe-S cluster assembly ATP-binding protein
MLAVEDLRLTQNGYPILRGIDLEVKAGETHTILGVNGAGKTTLAYAIMGSGGYRPDRGRITFLGKDITNYSIPQRARLGLTLAWQKAARFEGLTVREYLSLGMAGKKDSKGITRALELVALDPEAFLDRPVDGFLSGGERKRIELAAVLAMGPKLAILDEPDSGIDMLSVGDILKLIEAMANGGSTILLITHREELAVISDRISLMCDGLIIKTGKPTAQLEFFKMRCKPCPAHKYTAK